MYKAIDLTAFPKERKEKLKAIKRYAYFHVMMYRSNDWNHIQRVLWLTEEILPLAKKYLNLDEEKARAYAVVHDDAEMVTGDVQAIVKLRMTPEELNEYEEKEQKAIEELIKTYPKTIHGYSYGELLMNAAKKDTIESKLVSYVDKLDAYCESLHEVYAGNISFLRSVIFYARALALFPEKYPELKKLLESKESPLTYITDQVSPFDIKLEMFELMGKPDTEASLKKGSDMPFYNTWLKIVLERGGKEGKEWLLKQQEFLPQ